MTVGYFHGIMKASMVTSVVYGPAASGKTRRLLKAHLLAEKYALPSAMLTPYNPEPGAVQGFSSRDHATAPISMPVLGQDALPSPQGLKILYVDNAQYLGQSEVHWLMKHYIHCDWLIFFARRYRQCDITGVEEYPIFSTLMSVSNLPDELLGTCRYCKGKHHYLHPVRGKRHRVNFICAACLQERGREELKHPS